MSQLPAMGQGAVWPPRAADAGGGKATVPNVTSTLEARVLMTAARARRRLNGADNEAVCAALRTCRCIPTAKGASVAEAAKAAKARGARARKTAAGVSGLWRCVRPQEAYLGLGGKGGLQTAFEDLPFLWPALASSRPVGKGRRAPHAGWLSCIRSAPCFAVAATGCRVAFKAPQKWPSRTRPLQKR